MLQITKESVTKLFSQSRDKAPLEACGYLAGKDSTITKCYPLTNIEQSSHRFKLDVKEQFTAVKDARQEGLNILAVYHSHPESKALPSSDDINLAFDPDLSHIIISLLEQNLKSFKIIEGKSTEEKLIIV